jgi:hypothetical protein
MMSLRFITWSLIAAALYSLVLTPAPTAQASAECAAGLTPDVSLKNVHSSVKYAFLQLIDEAHYNEAKSNIRTSGDAELLGLITLGGIDANWEQFRTNRDTFLSKKSIDLNVDVATSTAKYSVPESARHAYFECVRRARGLKVLMLSESKDEVNVEVHYRGDPGSSAIVRITASNATPVPRNAIAGTHRLDNEGSYGFTLRRDGGKTIRVTANAPNRTAHAVSTVPPAPAVTTPLPLQGTIQVVIASYAANCNVGAVGNLTAVLSKLCDGKPYCDYAVASPAPADPCNQIRKEFTATYRCNNQKEPKTVAIPGESVGKVATLTCQ